MVKKEGHVWTGIYFYLNFQEKVTLDIQKNFKMADKRKDKNPWKFIMTRSKDRGIHLKDWQKTGFNKIEIPASSMMLNANFFLLAITMLAQLLFK